MICPKCNGKMEENRIRTHMLWIDAIHQIPDEEKQLGPRSPMYVMSAVIWSFTGKRNWNRKAAGIIPCR